MKVIIFGGDGYCAWPTALYLSRRGHDVQIVDNLSRRKIDLELGVSSLTPIHSIQERIAIWKEHEGKEIKFHLVDVAKEPHKVQKIVSDFRPDTVLHYAEQRAAPISMKNSHYKRYTLTNNLSATHNILEAIVESGMDIHLIHLGSMGVYGYFSRDCKIPEGYLDVIVPGKTKGIRQRFLCPGVPASIYHVTKMQDAIMFQFYNLNYGVKITDLHQGVVWGTWTDETKIDERLINRFDYDGDYGTFVNRFLMQAAIGYPLTVYGRGGQCRPIIHIKDSMRCIELALENPPRQGESVHIYNQMTEVFQIRDIAQMISDRSGIEIRKIPNPRVENEEVRFDVDNGTLLSLGLKPTLFSDNLMEEVMEVARRFAYRCDHSKILPSSEWRKKDLAAASEPERKEEKHEQVRLAAAK